MSIDWTAENDVAVVAALGSVAGAAAWCIGVIVVGLLGNAARGSRLLYDVSSRITSVMGDPELAVLVQAAKLDRFPVPVTPDWLTTAGWLYHEVHFASTRASIGLSGLETPMSDTFALHVASPESLLVVVPAALLVGAGYTVAETLAVTDPQRARRVGASVVLGYGLASAVSLPLLVRRAQWSISLEGATGQARAVIEVDPVTGILLTGVAFPVVFGALGGFLFVHESGTPESA